MAGFGRIGRSFYRALRRRRGELDVVAVNDLGDPAQLAHLLAYDSVAGSLPDTVGVEQGRIRVGDDTIAVLAHREPAELPWADFGVDIVVESTRFFATRAQAAAHLDGGARYVVIAKPSPDADATFVVGVNHDRFDPQRHRVVSNASCTTNCLAPMAKVLDNAFGLASGLMTTVHAYTSDQSLVDAPDDDWRRGRAAAINIVPTATGAARATSLVLPDVGERLDGVAVRVPVPDGSLTDLTVTLRRRAGIPDINEAFRAAAEGPLGAVLDYSEAPLVSTDIVGNPASCVFDAGLTTTSGELVKVFGWYDNEWGYSNRLVDLCRHMATTAATLV